MVVLDDIRVYSKWGRAKGTHDRHKGAADSEEDLAARVVGVEGDLWRRKRRQARFCGGGGLAWSGQLCFRTWHGLETAGRGRRDISGLSKADGGLDGGVGPNSGLILVVGGRVL